MCVESLTPQAFDANTPRYVPVGTITARKNVPERKTAPAGNRGLTSAGTSRQEALMSILLSGSDTHTEARRTPAGVNG